MAGIYVHVPFCRKACHYCDFHFSTSLAKRTEMVDAICKELLDRKAEITEEIETIYFGGGTPSVLNVAELQDIISQIQKHYSLSDSIEVTLEANPDDCSMINLDMWKSAGVNRLSIGVQSFRQEDLEWMNRSHNSLQAVEAIENAHKAGFEAINLDLIYGIPSMPKATWHQNVALALDLPIDHISAYSLTVEPGTALNHFINNKKYPALKDEKAAEELEYFQQAIEDKGWEQYEISNYCKPNAYAVHNTNYWRQKLYIGVGPSAHSYGNGTRRWNIANNAKYLKAIGEGQPFWEQEELTVSDQVNERIMLGLRTKWGVDLVELQTVYGYALLEIYKEEINAFLSSKHVKVTEGRLYLTKAGIMLGDHIASELFMVE